MDFKEARHDPHRPSVLDPSEYVYVGCADDNGTESYHEVRHDVLRHYDIETGETNIYRQGNVPFYDATQDGRPNYRCHHCGKHGSNIRYFVFFLHIPTKVVITVGQICAKKLNLASKEDLNLQKRAKAYRKAHAVAYWAEAHPAEYTVLRDRGDNEFLNSVWQGLVRFGSLTAKQMVAVQRFAERAEKPVEASEPPATSKQVSFIKSLLAGREMASEARLKATEQLEAGLTKKIASKWIERLLTSLKSTKR